MQLTWLGAAGFKVDTAEGATLLINPYLSRPAQANPILPIQLADLAPVDEIFLSDGRFDHALDTPALARQTGAIIHALAPVCEQLAQAGVPEQHLQPIIPNTPKQVGSLRWQARLSQLNPADSSANARPAILYQKMPAHFNQLVQAWPPGEDVVYSFKIDGLTLLHFSSTHWGGAEIGELQPHIALLPVEGHADTAAAVRLAVLLRPRLVIPHHWDDYFPPFSQMSNLAEFETGLSALAPDIRVYRPIIGQSFDPINLLY